MIESYDKRRYKIVGALVGGIFLTAAAAWLPVLIDTLIALNLPASVAVNAAYGIFFILAALVSYAFVTELIRARILKRRCDEVLNTPDTTQLHDKQLFYSLAKKEIQLARRHRWPVSMVAIFVQPMKGAHTVADQDVSVQIRDIVLKELKEVMRCSDLAGSFTRNEYLLFLPDCSAENLRQIAERVMKRLSNKKIIVDDQTTYHLRCQMGLASLEPEVAEIQRLIDRALEALDRAKKKNQNAIESY